MSTQKVIAEKLGVTPVLVSRALSCHPSVALATRRRIEEAAREMGYDATSNLSARTLVARRYGKRVPTGTYAVLLPVLGGNQGPHGNNFFGPMLSGIENEALEQGLDLMISTHRTNRQPRWLREAEVDGIVNLFVDTGFFELLKEKQIPFVTVQHYHPGVPGIAPSDREGIYMAIEHLLKLGHRRLAYLGLKTSDAARRRLQGFYDGLRAFNLAPDDAFVNVSHGRIEEGAESVRELLGAPNARPRFTALVCHNDMMAMDAVRELERRGLRVPQDVSVTGFDDLSDAQHFQPRLTSLAFDLEGMGRRVMQLLLEQNGVPAEQRGGELHVKWPVRLAEHESSAPPASP